MRLRRIGAFIIVASMLFAGVVMVMPSAEAGRPVPPRLPDATLTGPYNFGMSMAADGGWTVVAAPYAQAAGFGLSGFIRVYDPSGNSIDITSPNAAYGSRFGYSVAIYAYSGTLARVVATAPFETVGGLTHAGMVYSFQIASTATGPIVSSWYELARPGGSVAEAHFGEKVATLGSDILVGGPYDDSGSLENAGRAYVFHHQSGTLWDAYTLSSPNEEAATWFGHSVAIASEGHFLVGAPFETVVAGGTTYLSAGRVYYFVGSTPTATIASPSPGHSDWFGWGLAAEQVGDDEWVVVGVPNGDYQVGRKTYSGIAYVYKMSSLPDPVWNLTMVAKKIQYSGYFASSVALDDTKVIVGDYSYDGGRRLADSGSAFIYALATGEYVETLGSPSPTEAGAFGGTVAMDDGRAVVTQAGTNNVYVFNAPA